MESLELELLKDHHMLLKHDFHIIFKKLHSNLKFYLI